VEDRIRQAKATGLRNLPCNSFNANAAWLEIIMAATDLVAWAKLIGFTDHPELARCEIATFRYRVLHVAARITAAPDNSGRASTPPGAGHTPSPPLGAASAPPSPPNTPIADLALETKDPALESPPTGAPPGDPSRPPATIKRDTTGSGSARPRGKSKLTHS
jgi:Transposase DDE domain group 1